METKSLKLRASEGLIIMIDEFAEQMKCDRSAAMRILLFAGAFAYSQMEPEKMVKLRNLLNAIHVPKA